MLSVLRFIFDTFCILLFRNGIGISVSGEIVLYISGALFRYALLCDFLYCVCEIIIPWLYEKINSLVFRLFPINKKGFDE